MTPVFPWQLRSFTGTMASNSAAIGGAVYVGDDLCIGSEECDGSVQLTLTGCDMRTNRANDQVIPIVRNCKSVRVFEFMHACTHHVPLQGGALFVGLSAVLVTNCRLSENTARVSFDYVAVEFASSKKRIACCRAVWRRTFSWRKQQSHCHTESAFESNYAKVRSMSTPSR